MHAPSIATTLRGRGRNVVVAATPALRGLPDAELLAEAAASGRALVTENVADFDARR